MLVWGGDHPEVGRAARRRWGPSFPMVAGETIDGGPGKESVLLGVG